MSGRARSAAWHALLFGGALVALFPMLWMLSASFMATGEALHSPPRLLPAVPTAEHYRALFVRLDLGRAFASSLLVSVLVTAGSLLVNAMAGYALAKLRFRGRERLVRLLSAGLVVPVQVTMLPLFLLFREMGLINSYAGVVLAALASIFGIFLVRQYALAIPDDLLDAARMDGAGEFRLFFVVVLPVIRPILATLAIWTFLGTWNDFLWPLIVLSDQSRYTLPVALASLAGEHVQDTELMMAGSVVTVLPVLAVFLLLQRYYIRGVMAGSVKG